MCFNSVKDACKATEVLQTARAKCLPRGTERMLLLLEVGCAGEGSDSIKSRGADGHMMCTSVVPIKLSPMPATEVGTVLPRAGFWLPGRS